ncbi:MAG TPA: PIN domain-containing protein [Lacunisphaera sp.]|jgi:predicted nucleic acid-binding protein
MKPSVIAPRRVILVDAGPLVAAIDSDDPHHRWAKAILPQLTGRLLSCEAVAAAAALLLGHEPIALNSLHGFLQRMELVPVLRDELNGIFARLQRAAPRMDLADGCLLALASRDPDAVVLTTNTRDFATYGVPFVSPLGLFA